MGDEKLAKRADAQKVEGKRRGDRTCDRDWLRDLEREWEE